MVVLKNLALGFLMTGMVTAPSLAGSMRHGHHPAHQADGELQTPTSLASASASRPALENLALIGTGSFGIGNSGYGPAFGYGTGTSGNTALGSTSSIWGTTSSNTAPAPTTFYVAPTPAAAAPAPIVATPAVASYSAPASTNAVMAAMGMGSGGGPDLSQSTSNHTVDAYLNFTSSGFSEASALTTGTPQAWYLSPAVQHVFGGTPTASQQASFIAEVVQTVDHAYAASGMNVSVTTDPTQNYAHTMSIVSGASYSGNTGAIGITDVGNDGFSFIDKFGQAQNADQLAIAVGNNLAHELMHAFGVAIHPDQTGTHIDAATATWNVLTDPNSTFSQAAVQLLSTENFLNGPGKDFTTGTLGLSGLEVLANHTAFTGEASVPEPTTIALWGLAGGIDLVCHRRRAR